MQIYPIAHIREVWHLRDNYSTGGKLTREELRGLGVTAMPCGTSRHSRREPEEPYGNEAVGARPPPINVSPRFDYSICIEV